MAAVVIIRHRAENDFAGIGIGETPLLPDRIDTHGNGVDQLVHAADRPDGLLAFQAVHHRQDRRVPVRQRRDVADGAGQVVVFQGHQDEVGRFGRLVRVNRGDRVQPVVYAQGRVFQVFVAFAACHEGDRKTDGIGEHGGVGRTHGSGPKD